MAKIIPAREAQPLIKSGKLKPAYLYEPGARVLVDFGSFKRVYRVVDPPKSK